MGFHKTARKQHTCGECKHLDRTKGICKHKEMKGRAVAAHEITPCGGSYFQPLDDYERN